MAGELFDRLQIIRLFDAYGALLTVRQQRLLRWYFHDDLSLSEIADRLDVTRQAVFDALRRSMDELQRLESSLRMVSSREAATRRRRALQDRLHALEGAVKKLGERVGRSAVTEVAQKVSALRRAVR